MQTPMENLIIMAAMTEINIPAYCNTVKNSTKIGKKVFKKYKEYIEEKRYINEFKLERFENGF